MSSDHGEGYSGYSGGELEVEVKREDNPDIAKSLNRNRVAGRNDSNLINRESGYYATPTL